MKSWNRLANYLIQNMSELGENLMSSIRRQVAMSEEPTRNDREVSAPPSNGDDKARSDKREFSWYGGKVDEDVVREIVRLKREQKL